MADVCTQGELHLIESEITQLRESNHLQKKRLMETVSSVLKDLAEVGTVFGGELKVIIFIPFIFLFFNASSTDVLAFSALTMIVGRQEGQTE